jgi:hypothetical protein
MFIVSDVLGVIRLAAVTPQQAESVLGGDVAYKRSAPDGAPLPRTRVYSRLL